MDSAKLLAKIVIALGLLFAWPGPWVAKHLPIEPASRRTARAAARALVTPAPLPANTGDSWFDAAKGSCNSVEVGTYLRTNPAPEGFDGAAYGAACLALAGRIDDARARILDLTPDERWSAAGVVFEAGHPAADAGDDVAAGPLMELVVEFWPNHYMALYHAGAARYQRGDVEESRDYLERFLQHYDANDGWTRSAREMLAG